MARDSSRAASSVAVGPPAEFLAEAAEYLKVMAHPSRLRIALVLSGGPQSVNQIAEACELPPNQACEHLRLLKRHGLLDSERRGRVVCYRIVSPRLPRLLKCMQSTWDGGEH